MKAEPRKSQGELGTSTLKGLAVLGSSTLLTAVFRVLFVGIMARLLAPEDFGVVAVSNIFVEFCRLITTSGIAQSMVQKEHLTDGEIRTAFTVSMAGGLVTMIALVALSPFIASFFDLPQLQLVLIVCSVIAPLTAVSTISSKLLERDHNFGPIARSNALSYIGAQVAVGIPIAYLGGGLWALVIPQVIAALWQSVVLMRAKPHSLAPHFDRAEYRDLMALGTGFGLQRFANFIAQRGDYFVVGKMLGPLALGRYERSYVLMNLSNTLLASSLSTVLFPAFSRVAKDSERFGRAYLRTLCFAGFVTLPVSVLSIALAPEIVETLLGRKWIDAATPFAILSAGIFARTAYKIAGNAGNGLGLAYQNAVSQTLYAVFVVGGAAIGAMWSVEAVAVSTLFAIFVVFVSLNHTVLRAVGLSWVSVARTIAPGLVSALLLGAIAFPAAMFLRVETAWPAVLRLVVSSGVAGMGYLPCALLAPGIFLGADLIAFAGERLPRRGPAGKVARLLASRRGGVIAGVDGGK